MQLKIYVPKHPLIEHLTNLMQSVDIPPALVKNSAIELAYWLCYEAMRNWLTLTPIQSNSLDGQTTTELINTEENILALPLIKSGLLMSESVHKLFAGVNLFYVSFKGEKSSCDVTDEDKQSFTDLSSYSKFLILDSIVLSSNKILALLSLMMAKNVDLSSVRIIFLFCTSDVLQDIGKLYPNLTIYTSCVKDISEVSNLNSYQMLLKHLQT